MNKFPVLVFLFALVGPVLGATPAVPAPKPAPASVATPTLPLSEPHYFFTLDLDARYELVGKGALTEEQAATANCYRFIYNDAGRLQQIEYRRAGSLMPDPLFGVASIDFEYQPGMERRWFHGAKSEPVNDGYGVAGEELQLNAAGCPITITNLDEGGGKTRDSDGVIQYVRTLDSRNRVVSLQRIGLLGTAITDKEGYYETHTTYDDHDRVIERDNHDSSGALENDADGVAIVRTSYTIYPDSTQLIESYFDASSLAAEEKSSGAHEVQRTFDQRGLLLSESYFDTTGAPCLDVDRQVHERRYTYDDRGNELSEEYYDTDGKLKDLNQAGFARKAYKYDDKNRVIEISFFGDDGAPEVLLNLNAAIIRQDYDADGNLVRRQFFDGQGHPSPHKTYGAPAIRIRVDGDTTFITLRDAKDDVMKNAVHGFCAFSYKPATDEPLSPKNQYYDRHGRPMSNLRVFIINPHLYALKTTPVMQASARYGAAAAGLGALLGGLLALRKSFHTRRRRVYVPSPLERLLGWFSIFAILEGSLRFFLTIYWAAVGYLNGRMGPAVYILEAVFILFFIYRLFRMRVTMRVLNIAREDVDKLLRGFFARAGLVPDWNAKTRTYVTPALDVRLRFFEGKYHAYLAFRRRGIEGKSLAIALARHIRTHAAEIEAPLRNRVIAFYYRSVAACYFLLSATAFYTLWQLVKRY